ncbi:MAG: hypothetical protein J2P57_25125, partial [Acidimicrobiaceae bacterium]|nr:hypothetical protein [Acidimicrobiaceae bacterium]
QSQVAAAVARSVGTTTVPANLNPPLAGAASSESAEAVNCLLEYTQTFLTNCVFGDQAATATMVLFGDSHATMWFPAVDAAAKAMHERLVLFTKATCPPIQLTMFSPVLGRTFTECNEWRNAAVARIQSLRPSVIVLASAPGYGPAGAHVALDGPQWLGGQAAVIRELRQSGARVVTLGPVPAPFTNVPVCLSAHLTSVPGCDIPDRKARPYMPPGYNEVGLAAERRTVAEAGGLFVDVQPWFCTATTCPVIVDNLLVFRDASHITIPYATYVAPLMTLELQLALRSSTAPPSRTPAGQRPRPATAGAVGTAPRR